MKDGLFIKRDRQDTMWIYLWFEGQESLVGYLTKNAVKEQERILRFIAAQKDRTDETRQAVATE